MILKFNSIEMHNFKSIGDAKVSLSNEGFVLVDGINNFKDDNAQSNGAGKSSIIDAISYALTGETSLGVTKNIENIFGDPNDCYVEIDITVDNKNYIIRRAKTPKSDLKIYINGEDCSGKGIRETEILLGAYLPDLTNKLLSSIIILGQGLPHRFSNNTPAARKDVLESLTKSDFMINDIKEKLDTRSGELKTFILSTEKEITKLTTEINDYNTQLKNINTELSKLNDIDTDINEYNIKLATLKNNLSEHNNIINENTTLINNCDNELNTIAGISLPQNLIDLNKEIHDKDVEIASIKMRGVTLAEEVKRLSNIKDICPTCGQKLPHVHKVDTAQQQEELKTLREQYKEMQRLNNNLISKRDELTEDFNNNKAEDIAKITSLKSNYQAVINEHRKSINGINNDILDVTKKLAELTNLNNNKVNFQNQLSALQEGIAAKTLLLEEKHKDLESINKHSAVITKLTTISKRDFRGILLKNIIESLNNKAKEYSKIVFGTTNTKIVLNGNSIEICYNNKIYECLSGGEKQKIDIIIQLALRAILSRYLNIHSNILIIDEVFDNLDKTGCQKIVELIEKIKDLDSIFIISHHTSDLNLTWDKKITVIKNEQGISSII